MDYEYIKAQLLQYVKDKKIKFNDSQHSVWEKNYKTICQTYIVHFRLYRNIVLNVYKDKMTFEVAPYTKEHQTFII